MKIALKYGLLITAVVVAWVVIVRLIMDLSADSKANLIAPIIFNLAAIIAIYCGMKARKRELGGELPLKEGLKTGVAISFVYATTACLFFIVEYLLLGPKLLMSDMGPSEAPMWQVAAMAYTGLFLGSILFGLVYSTAIAFFIARRQRRDSTQII